MFGYKSEEVGGRKWKFHNEFNNFYSSPYIRMIKSSMMVGHVPCKQDTRKAHKILAWKCEGWKNLEDLDIDGSMLLK
jgi:hypothetical protein